MMTNLHEYIESASRELKLPYCKVAAHIEKEAHGEFRWSEGRIPMLYERHYAYRWLVANKGRSEADKLSKLYPRLINPVAGGYGKYRDQYPKLVEMINIGLSECGHYSASWSAFQIMGAHYELLGFRSAEEMVRFLHEAPEKHAIIVYTKFMLNYRDGTCLEALRNDDIQTFSRLYNGKGYKKNNYDKEYLRLLRKCRYEYPD